MTQRVKLTDVEEEALVGFVTTLDPLEEAFGTGPKSVLDIWMSVQGKVGERAVTDGEVSAAFESLARKGMTKTHGGRQSMYEVTEEGRTELYLILFEGFPLEDEEYPIDQIMAIDTTAPCPE